MIEISENNSIETSSDKSFGVVFSLVFFIVAIYLWINSEGVYIWELVISILFLLLAYVRPVLLAPLNRLWFKFGMLLSSIVTPIVMAIIYIVVVIPTGVILRILGKDPLKQRLDRDLKSYWIEREDPVGTMKNQF